MTKSNELFVEKFFFFFFLIVCGRIYFSCGVLLENSFNSRKIFCIYYRKFSASVCHVKFDLSKVVVRSVFGLELLDLPTEPFLFRSFCSSASSNDIISESNIYIPL